MSVEETMNKLLLLGIFLSTIFYYCDYKGIKQYSLFHNHKNKLIRLFGQFLTLMLCWIILAIIVSLFIPTA